MFTRRFVTRYDEEIYGGVSMPLLSKPLSIVMILNFCLCALSVVTSDMYGYSSNKSAYFLMLFCLALLSLTKRLGTNIDQNSLLRQYAFFGFPIKQTIEKLPRLGDTFHSVKLVEQTAYNGLYAICVANEDGSESFVLEFRRISRNRIERTKRFFEDHLRLDEFFISQR